MRLAGKKRPKHHASQAGFTLLELLLVVAILSSLALAATAFVDTKDSQERYETTKNRLEMIRTAILGKADSIVNGQTVVSGFVADMGRLPANIRELLEIGTNRPWAKGNCYGASETWLPIFTKAECVPQYTWVANPGNLGIGWRGPYLQTLQAPDQSDAFTDGWGRESSDDNYGWVLAKSGGSLSVTSYGSDQKAGPSGQSCGDSYDSDCSIVISPEDYQANIGNSLSINLVKPYQGKCILTDFNSETTCPDEGANWEAYTWTSGACSDSAYSTQAECEAAATCSDAAYTNKTDCLNNSETWTPNWTPGFCSNSVYTDENSCEAAGVCVNPKYTNQDSCNFGGICSDTTKGNKAACEGAGGSWTSNTWKFETYQLCQRLYYRSNGNISMLDADNGNMPIIVSKNGSTEVIVFGFSDDFSVMLGAAAVDIREDDINNTYSCSNNVKSSNAATPIPLQFIPRASAPVININLLP